MNRNIIGMCVLAISGILWFSGGLSGKAATIFKEVYDGGVSEAEPYVITTGSAISVYNNSYQIQAGKEEKSNIVFPVVVTNSGLLVYDMEFLGTIVENGNISVAIYEDSQCQRPLNEKKTYPINLGAEQLMTDSIYIEKPQECYFQITVSDELLIQEEWYCFNIRLQEYNSEDGVLQNKEAVYAYQNGEGASIYYKVVAPKAGIFTINMDYNESSYDTARISLCNKEKKVLSDNCKMHITNSAKVEKMKETPKCKNIFAVSKGTYYLKLTNIKGTYKIQSQFLAIKESSGKTKNKAKKLSVGGKAVKGVILSTDKKTQYDWYKFRLEASDRVRVGFKGSTSNKEELRLEVIPPSSAKFSKKAILKFSGTDGNGSGKSGAQWPAGTYYLRINKTTAKGNGTYQLQVKFY